jgi:hypothetical protein
MVLSPGIVQVFSNESRVEKLFLMDRLSKEDSFLGIGSRVGCRKGRVKAAVCSNGTGSPVTMGVLAKATGREQWTKVS